MKIVNICITPKSFLMVYCNSSLPWPIWCPSNHWPAVYDYICLHLSELHISKIVQYITLQCGFSQLVYLFWDSFGPFCFLPNSIPLYVYTTIYSWNCWRHLDLSRFCLLQIMLLGMFLYKFLSGHLFTFLVGKHLGLEWLDYMAQYCIFSFLRNC
jgi:hypothetical protein